MLLSEIVAFKNQLDNSPSIPLVKLTADHDLLKIIYLAETQTFVPEEYKLALDLTRTQLQDAFDNIGLAVEKFKEQVNKCISQQEIHFYEQSYKLYLNTQLSHQKFGYYNSPTPYLDDYGNVRLVTEENKKKYSDDINTRILNQQLEISDDTLKIMESRVSVYADWRYPSAILRPNSKYFINTLVASDPLYLLDEHMDLLSPIINEFNQQYQNRLRPYVINELPNRPILDKLPTNQFMLFLAYNYFNYKPFEVIKQYLEEIFQVLRPGGVLAMTFNDCDRHTAVRLTENTSACYTPGHVILSMIKNIGYKHIFQHKDGPMTWIELQKPGSMASIRGSQTLAKINQK
jgi:hypothetical protein